MVTIEFTTIPDLDVEYDLLLELLANFKDQTGIEVKPTRMQWGDAWEQLTRIATQGHGADISYVGSTWVSSLVSMNALRPLPPQIITNIGSEESYIHSTWQSVIMEEDKNPWCMPLSTHVYAIAYRRDLLAQSGLDPATAFATPFEVERTVSRLEELHLAEKAWLMPNVLFPYSDEITHTAATWIWSSGGQLVDNRGKQVLFDNPAALAGLKAYFKLLRRQPETEPMDSLATMQRLIEGKAAAVLTDTRAILTYLQEDTPAIRNIGAASVMSIPYSGGGSLVIWRHTYGYPEHPLRPVIIQLVSSGRTYPTIRLWRRVESQLGQELSMIAKTVLEDKDTDLDTLLAQTMKALTQRLNLTLE